MQGEKGEGRERKKKSGRDGGSREEWRKQERREIIEKPGR